MNIESNQCHFGTVGETAFTLPSLIKILSRNWILLIIIPSLIAAAVFLYSRSLTPQYRATVDLVYVPPSEGVEGSIGGALGGIGSLIGIDSAASPDRSVALGILRSRKLSERFIQEHSLAELMFPENWDPRLRTWTGDKEDIPTADDIYRKFNEDARRISIDEETGLIRVSFTLPLAKKAALAANDIVKEADKALRLSAISEAKNNLRYLESQLKIAQIAELRSSIATLMEIELQRVTLASSRDYYAFKVIDPAVVPVKPEWPKPVLMSMVAGILCLLVTALAIAVIAMARTRR